MKRKTHSVVSYDGDAEFEEHQAMEDLIDAAVESVSPDLHTEKLESFEAYTHALRGHIKDHLPGFRERFIKGYTILLDEIAKRQ